jgi:hypothetical protein
VPYATVFMWSGWPRAGRAARAAISHYLRCGLCRSAPLSMPVPAVVLLSDAGDEIVGSLSLCVIVSIITSIGRQSYVVVKSLRILRSSRVDPESNGFDACGYDPTRGRGARVGPQPQSAPLNPLRSIVCTAGSFKRALTSLPDSDLLPISVSLSHFPRADKCDVTILQPSRAVGSATLSSLHATRVAACLRRWTLIPCHLPLPQGPNGRRALGALSATTPVVDAIRRSRQIMPDHARSCQITSDRLYSPFTTAATSAAPPARRARARGAPRTPHRT